MTSHYPIRVAARLTGLSVDTLRAWERRYQAVVPDRGERGRAYTDRHVSRLKLLAARVAEGHAIGSIAGLSDAALTQLGTAGARPETSASAVDLAPLLKATNDYDLPAIESILTRHALLQPPAELIFSVVLPVLHDIGARWQNGALRPSHEHLVSSVIRHVLGSLLRTARTTSPIAPIVFATPAGERHELGLLCAAVLAASAGHRALYLGPDLPAADIAHAISMSGARVLVLAATSPATLDREELRPLRRLPEGVAVWAGGAMGRELQAAIGARARYFASLKELHQQMEADAR